MPTGADLIRLRHNQLFHEMSSAFDEVQRTGILEWSNTLDFRRFAPCQKAGQVYIANVATGPATGNATDPETRNQQVWRAIGTAPPQGSETLTRDEDALKIRKWAGGANGAVNRRDPSDALRETGFPATYSDAGGDTPSRLVLNQIFCELTAMAREIQQKGILEWSDRVDYVHDATRVGYLSEGKETLEGRGGHGARHGQRDRPLGSGTNRMDRDRRGAERTRRPRAYPGGRSKPGGGLVDRTPGQRGGHFDL